MFSSYSSHFHVTHTNAKQKIGHFDNVGERNRKRSFVGAIILDLGLLFHSVTVTQYELKQFC